MEGFHRKAVFINLHGNSTAGNTCNGITEWHTTLQNSTVPSVQSTLLLNSKNDSKAWCNNYSREQQGMAANGGKAKLTAMVCFSAA